jgi:hypothetical protein
MRQKRGYSFSSYFKSFFDSASVPHDGTKRTIPVRERRRMREYKPIDHTEGA